MTDSPPPVLLLLLLLAAAAASPRCPPPCTCGPAEEPGLSVDCSGLGLASVPRGLPPDTAALLLGRNELGDLFGRIPPLPGLARLDLSRNRVQQLGRGAVFRGLGRLTALNLSGNAFRTVFNGVFRGAPRLEVLDLGRGQVRFVEERAFEGLGRLRRLLLAHNQLGAVFPEWFAGLGSLEELRLEDNRVSYVNGGAFCGLAGLRLLSLAGNRIRGMSDRALDGLGNLTSLNLEDNQLGRVPATALRAARSLRVLRLGGNSFPQLGEGDFARLPSLEEATVEEVAELEIVDRGAFRELPSLRALHLHRNSRLRFVDPGAFVDVPNLRILSLHGGNLSALSEGVVEGFARPLQISLHGNPLRCDCNAKWLHEIVAGTRKSRISVQEADSLSCVDDDSDGAGTTDSRTGDDHRVVTPDSAHSGKSDDRLNSPEALTTGFHSKEARTTGTHSKEVHQTTETHSKAVDPSLVELGGRPLVPLASLAPSRLPARCAPSLAGAPEASVRGKVGDSLVFQCRAHGLPPPTIRWTLPSGAVITNTSNDVRIRAGPGSLALHHVRPRDSGPYACAAENPLGAAAALVRLSVDSVDVHIFPLGVASTFVTVVWNGTARSSFPEYEIVYGRADGGGGRNRSVTVSQFFRSYTVNGLRPSTPYRFCIGVREPAGGGQQGYVQFSCTRARTLDEGFALQGVAGRTSGGAVAAAVGVAASMGLVVCGAALAARKYRQRHYDPPPRGKTLVPMESLHSPLMAAHGSRS